MNHTAARSLIATLALYWIPTFAAAHDIPVSAAAGVGINSGDSQCSLIEALENANDTVSGNIHADCASGDPAGSDTLSLPAGATFTATAGYPNASDPNALPAITSEIVVDGHGAILERDSASAEAFRLFEVTAAGDLTLRELTLRGGAPTGAGGAVINAGALTIVDSTLSANTATGGGAVTSSGTATISNSTLSGNTATADGGALHQDAGTLDLWQVTLADNTAGDGDAIHLAAGTLTLRNSLIAGNGSGSACTQTSGLFRARGNNLDDDGTCAALAGNNFITSATPMIASLADNGGPTQTHALLDGSPAIDAGVRNEVPDDLGDRDGNGFFDHETFYDQRGPCFPRVVSQLDWRLQLPDLGAFEFLDAHHQVTTAAELIAAIETVNTEFEADNNYEAAIEVLADIDLTTAYGGTNGTPTVISKITVCGNGHTVRRNSAENFRIFDVNSSGPTSQFNIPGGNLEVHDLTIRDGRLEPGGDALGGGLAARGGPFRLKPSIHLRNVTVTHNVIIAGALGGGSTSNGRVARGGGIYTSDGSLLSINYSTITDNSAFGGDSASSLFNGRAGNGQGGGVYAGRGATITHTTISGNSATGGQGTGGSIRGGNGTGGGLWGNFSMQLHDVELSHNTATGERGRMGRHGNGQGGGFTFGGADDLVATGLRIEGNTSTGVANGLGGGLFLGGASSATISGLVLIRNHAEDNGGGYLGAMAGGVTITDSCFVDNTTSEPGGVAIDASNDLHDLESNWWGSSSGPGPDAGNGLGETGSVELAGVGFLSSPPAGLDCEPTEANVLTVRDSLGSTIPDEGTYVFPSTPAGTPITETFEITQNTADPILLLEPGPVVAGNFSTGVFSGDTVPAMNGGSVTFDVTCDATEPGLQTGGVAFSDSATANPFGFTVECPVEEPEIVILDVTGGNVEVADDSGSVAFGATPLLVDLDRDFRIRNDGPGELRVTGLTLPAEFSSALTLPASLPSAGTLNFTVTCSAATEGNFTGRLELANTDTDEAPYDFEISCTVVTPVPTDVAVTKTVDVAKPQLLDSVTFTITATNHGPGVASNLVINDPLPSGVTRLGDSPSQGSYDGTSWTVGTLAAGASATLDVTVTADPGVGDPMGTGDLLGDFVTPGSGGLDGATFLRFGADGHLYVLSSNTHEVLRYDGVTGAFSGAFVTAGAGGLSLPFGLTFGKDGDLYVSSQTADEVLRYDGTTGDTLGIFSNFVFPGALITGADGDLYVAGPLTQSVLRIDGDDGTLILPPYATGVGSSPLDPIDIAFGPGGDLYATIGGSQEVLRFDGATGAPLGAFVSAGAGGLDSPRGLTFGPEGDLYVASEVTREVLRYDGATGAFLEVFASNVDAYGLAFGPGGDLFAADPVTQRVQRFDGFITNVAEIASLDQSDTFALNNRAVVGIDVQKLDFGDAPDPVDATAGEYPTRLAQDGARHAGGGLDLRLGTAWDGEIDALPSPDADGDDSDRLDDEDGVTFSTVRVGAAASIDVVVTDAGAAGRLNAWIDWNRNGSWTDAEEQIATDLAIAAVSGSQTIVLNFTVPADATPGTTYARFRLDSAGGLLPTGLATDGEVEDVAITVLPDALGFSKAFSPAEILAGGLSRLTFTIDNTSNVVPIGGLAFSDDLSAAEMALAAIPNASTTCGGTLSADPGAGSLSFSGGTVGAGGACTVSVDVTSATFGSHLNTSSTLASDSGTEPAATAVLTIVSPPGFDKSFQPQTISKGGVARLTFIVDNTAGGISVPGLSFADPLPAGVEVAGAPNPSDSCSGGTLTAVPAATQIVYAGATVAAGEACEISVDVVGLTTGAHLNTTDPLDSAAGTGSAASATLTVIEPPAFSKIFAPSETFTQLPSTLTFTIDSTANPAAVTGLAFTDDLPAGVEIRTVPNVRNTCVGGTLSAPAAGTSISYSDGSVPAGGSCEIEVDVTSALPGVYDNVSTPLTSSAGVSPGNGGHGLNWAAGIGDGDGTVDSYAVAAGIDGSVVSVGNLSGTLDFDPGPGSVELSTATRESFVLKLDPSGDLAWAVSADSSGFNTAWSVAVDGDANVVTSGGFSGLTDFDPGPGTFELTGAGTNDAFVWKLDTDGNLVWAAKAGSGRSDEAFGVTVDEAGNVYTVGRFFDTADFDPGPDTFELTALGGDSDIFVWKLSPAGELVWAVRAGGTRNDLATDVAIDPVGNVYVTGWFEISGFFGAENLVATGFNDAFLWKLDADGNHLWAVGIGGPSALAEGRSLVVDDDGVTLAGGFTRTVDFDPGAGVFERVSGGGRDVFLTRLSAAGALDWAVSFGTANEDQATGLAIDSTGGYAVGVNFFGTADFDPGPERFELESSTSTSVAVVRLDPSGAFRWADALISSSGGGAFAISGADAIDILPDGETLTTGSFSSATDFDPRPSSTLLTPGAFRSAFVARLLTPGAGDRLTVNPPPVFTKAFSPATMATGGLSTLVYTIDNTASALEVTGLAFTDILPIEIEIAADPAASTTCPGGVVSTAGFVEFLGGSVAAGASCTIQVDVTSSIPGAHFSQSSDLDSSANTSPAAAATLTVVDPPTLLKEFSADSVRSGERVTLTLTIDNSGGFTDLDGIGFTDPLPTGMVIATPSGLTLSPPSCGGTLSAPDGGTTIEYSNGTVGAASTCIIGVDVESTAGVQTNTTSDLSWEGNTSGSATDTLIVGAILDVTSTLDLVVPMDGLCTLREALNNANTNTETTGGDCAAGVGPDIILLPAGVYELALGGPDDDINAGGDLDVTDPPGLLLIGPGPRTTVLDGGGLDRVLDVHTGASFELEGVTVRGGSVPPAPGSLTDPAKALGDGGGGLRSAGTISLLEVRVQGNATPGNGGGLLINSGDATIRRCLFDANQAHTLAGASGGAIAIGASGETVLIEHSTLSGNTAERSTGGALTHQGTFPATLRYVTITGNSSGVEQFGTGELRIASSILTGNGVVECAGFPTSSGFNLFGADGSASGCPFGIEDLVPAVSPELILDGLADNDGPTDTHGVYFGSPAIDFVPYLENGCGSTGDSFDQRSQPRSGGGPCEAGAYEGIAVPVELQSFVIE